MRYLIPLEDQMKLEGKEDLKSGAFVGSLFYIQLHLEERNKHQFHASRRMEKSLQQAKQEEFVPSPINRFLVLS